MGRKKTGVYIDCLGCKETFYVPLCLSDKRKYCSLPCATLHSKSLRKGKNNPNWKGNDGDWAYSNIHSWIYREHGKAVKCVNIKCQKKSNNYEWANITGVYEREIENFVQLCRSCHVNFDVYKKPICLEYEKNTFKTPTGDKYKSLLQKVC